MHDSGTIEPQAPAARNSELIRESMLQVRGIATFVRECGQRSSEAIVFVHGNPSSSDDWLDLLPAAGQLGYAVALDMPNYGRSQRRSDLPCTVHGYAEHLGAVIDELGIQRVHFVLHDFGGPWALGWAARHREAVASVALFNTGVLPGYRWHKYARIWRTPLLGELFMAGMSHSAMRMLLRREYPRPLPDAFISGMYRHIDAASKRAQLALYRATPDLGALTERFGRSLAPLRLPALVVWGAGDTGVPVRFAELQSTYFDVTAAHILPDGGHWPFIDEPDPCRRWLLAFLRERSSLGSPG